MVSTTGAELLPKAAVSYFRELIIPLATILTPNIPEALKLLEDAKEPKPQLDTLQDMVTLAKRVSKLGCAYVLLKGGHLPLTGDGKVARNVKEQQMVVNVLCNEDKTYILRMDYQNAKNTHGTGCSLACKAMLYFFVTIPASITYSRTTVQNPCPCYSILVRVIC